MRCSLLGWTRPARVAATLVILLTLSCRSMASHETGFLNRSVTLGGARYPYVVYVPRDYDPSRSWPVVLFLHGSGERGSDGLRETQIGAGAAIRSAPERVPAIVVFPQAPAESRWLDESRHMHDSLIEEHAADVRYTEYPGVGHNAWEKAYGDPVMWSWLFGHARK